MNPPTYTQPIKQEVRERILGHAVAALTTRRATSPVVQAGEFVTALNYAVSFLRDHTALDWLDAVPEEGARWLRFHTTQVGTRRPEELRVLYLCGPEPVNDLDVLLDLGVAPQNIWAIESEKQLYRSAIDELKQHRSYIRIHHGKLDRFFEQVNERFDIIYLDACGPLPSASPNTLSLPLKMVEHERLAPLGVLITNFAEPSTDSADTYADLMTAYFSPRQNDCPHILTQAGADPQVAQHDPEYFRGFVVRHLTSVYSEFITRFLVDIARSIVPQRRVFGNMDLRRKYFADEPALTAAAINATRDPKVRPDTSPEEQIERFLTEVGHVFLSPSSYPIITFLQRVGQHRGLARMLEPILGKRVDGVSVENALLRIGLVEQIIEGHIEAASPEMIAAIRASWFDRLPRYFCDVPLPNLIVNTLFGIYGHPYQVNPRASLRVSYIAKETRMYLDCLLLDQCRYYFDYLPTIDLIPDRFQSPVFQLVLRACLDLMGRHDWSSSSHPFRGAALGSFDETPGQYDFAEREDYMPTSATEATRPARPDRRR